MDNILEVKKLGKEYKKQAQPKNHNIRDDLAAWWFRLTNRSNGKNEETIKALEDISFSLKKGDILGVVGRNGAGKSSLLNVLAGVVKPTRGQVAYQGRLVSILELGAGFHPDLTGKENVYLNGGLLGMGKAAIKDQFDAIVAFSELEEFINEPVKHYSNGMYLRLAFSIFAHLKSDILLLDEVMSVGDIQFRQKSYRKIIELAGSGTTVIIVSHDPDQVRDLCNKCLWLDHGKIMAFGDSASVLDTYLEKFLISETKTPDGGTIEHYYLSWNDGLLIEDQVKIYSYGLKAKGKSKEEPVFNTDELEIEMVFEKLNSDAPIEITVSVLSLYGVWVLVDSYGMYSRFDDKVKEAGRYSFTCTVPEGLINFGIYQLGFLVSKSEKLIYQNPCLLNFKVAFQDRPGVKNNLAKDAASIIRPTGIWRIEKSGFGNG